MSDEFRKNLMGPEPTLLPAETEIYSALDAGQEALDLVEKHPTSSLLWAVLAEEAWTEGRTIDSYAYARVGYHRGLDSLRRNGWRGVGPIPWEHEPNRGFLRALYSLGRASAAIDEAEEPERIEKFLNDSDPAAKAAIEAELNGPTPAGFPGRACEARSVGASAPHQQVRGRHSATSAGFLTVGPLRRGARPELAKAGSRWGSVSTGSSCRWGLAGGLRQACAGHRVGVCHVHFVKVLLLPRRGSREGAAAEGADLVRLQAAAPQQRDLGLEQQARKPVGLGAVRHDHRGARHQR